MTITLKQIRDAQLCSDGYRKLSEYVRDNDIKEPFCVSLILDSNDIADTAWTLKNVCGETGELICHIFACDAAERSLKYFEEKYPEDNRPRLAIEAKRKHIKKEITIHELKAARSAAAYAADAAAAAAYSAYSAYAAATAAAAYTAYAAAYANAAYAAAYAAAAAAYAAAAYADAAYADAAAQQKEIEWQKQRLKELIEEYMNE